MQNGFPKLTLLLSILVGACAFVCYGQFFDESNVDVTFPENWHRMSTQEKLDNLSGLLSKDAPFSPLSEIKQFKIRRQFKEMIVDKKDEVLGGGFNYRFGFRYSLGWEELSLLGLAGFASVWMLYVAARIIILLISPAPVIHFPSLPLGGGIESLNFRTMRQAGFLPCIKITLFSFLVLEEYPKRPGKPRVVRID